MKYSSGDAIGFNTLYGLMMCGFDTVSGEGVWELTHYTSSGMWGVNT